MNDPSQTNHNPFSTRFTKPGAIPYRFNRDINLDKLIDKFSKHDYHGQILGPHGSGKSTLVSSLLPMIDRKQHLTTIHQADDKRQIFRTLLDTIEQLSASDLLVIDGFEQLSNFQRNRLIKACKRKKVGLLVTAHQPVNLPTLFEMPIDLEMFRSVVEQLQRDSFTQVPQTAIDEAYEEYQPNLREALFRLYDIYEIMRRQSR